MPKDIHQRDTAQQRSSRLLLAMGIIVLLGALAYFVLTLVVNRRTPASPDTRCTAENGISVYYESAVWPVCEMTEDATLGRALELASAQSSDDANYQVVLFQKGTKDTYEDFIGQSEKELKQAYGVISPRKVDLNIDGAAVTAVRCDIQAYYAVLATIEYDNGDVIYVSGLTKAGLHQRHRQPRGEREPVMSDTKAMQRLCGLMRKAVQQYEMLAPGDRVLVGVSGGKDSVALTIGLARLRQYLGFPFEVVAVTLDPQFGGKPVDYSALEALFRRYDVSYEVRRTLIGPIVFDYRNEKNPCSLCAKMRRGALHTAAEELDCNKVALGHHLDDAIETFYMNLWREGRIGCFSPVTELSDRGLTLIRPLLLATEQEVRCAVKEEGFPIVKSRCPADGVTTREDTKNFVRERCRTDRAFRQKTLHALQESGIDGWRPLHPARTSKKENTAHADARI